MTTSSGTSIHTQVRLTGGLPVRFARRGAPAPGEPVPSPASSEPPRAEYHDPAIRRARQATARAARKTR